jgi:hypothetical protein
MGEQKKPNAKGPRTKSVSGAFRITVEVLASYSNSVEVR